MEHVTRYFVIAFAGAFFGVVIGLFVLAPVLGL